MYSLYWATTTLATVGYGDFSAANPAEALWATIYMFFNLALGAYVLGTITLLVVKSDERTGRYRDMSQNLKQYNQVNEIPQARAHVHACTPLTSPHPQSRSLVQGTRAEALCMAQDLSDSMHAHLRLHFGNEEASDEHVRHLPFSKPYYRAQCVLTDHLLSECVSLYAFAQMLEVMATGNQPSIVSGCLGSSSTKRSCAQVLHIFPTTIRRRILRHLYLEHVRSAYLFKGVRQKFIDALLGAARIELFMPQVRCSLR